MKIKWISRMRARLAFWLLDGWMPIEVEARHGAFRTRSRQQWRGGVIRVDIPLQKERGATDTPFGRVDSQTAKQLIDSFTGVEGEDAFQECRPGSEFDVRMARNYGGKAVCAACGQDLPRVP